MRYQPTRLIFKTMNERETKGPTTINEKKDGVSSRAMKEKEQALVMAAAETTTEVAEGTILNSLIT